MAASGSRNFVETADEICDAALDLVGAKNQGSQSFLADKEAARLWLNRLVQSLSKKNIMQLWTRERRSNLYVSDVLQTVVTSGTATYDLGQDVLEVMADDCFVRRSSIDSMLRPMGLHEYQIEGNKTASGMPTRFLIEANQSYTDSGNSRVIQGRLRITLHPVPNNSTDAIHYVCTRKLQDFDASTNDPDAPPVWSRCLIYGLAADLAVKYGVGLDERRDIRAVFEQELKELRAFDTPRGSMRLSPRMPRMGLR